MLPVVALCVVFALLSVRPVLAAVGMFLRRKSVGHDLLGWHECDGGEAKGEVVVGKCSVCGEECYLDDEGIWR